jgi:hypothetical protein
MAKRIQFRRGTTTEHATFIGAPGELTIDTTKKTVVVHDGSTPGGFSLTRLDSTGGASTFTGASAFTGQLRAQASIASTSVSTGSIVVTGGMGIQGTVTASNLVAGSITETSSITFKKNVNPLTDALNSILKLNGVIYDRRDTNEKNEAGLIAEDVNKVLPNLVTKDENGKPYGIQYTKLVAYLVEAIKDQQHQINELKKKV